MIQQPTQPQAPGQAPGQAPMPSVNALPGMLAQQRGQTPPPQMGQLVRMPIDQLKQLFFQSMSMDTGLQPLTVLAAIKQASENQKLQQAIQGQAFRQQAAQQPGTVRDEVLAQAPSGGIVTLNQGGPVQKFQSGSSSGGLTTGFAPDYQEARRFGINLSPYDSPDVRAEKLARLRAMKDFEAQQAQGRAEIPTEESVARDEVIRTAYAAPSRGKDLLRVAPPPIAAAPAPTPAPSEQRRRQPAAAPATPPGGIADIGPEIPTSIQAMRDAAKAREEAIRKSGVIPESVLNARKGIDALLAEQSGAFTSEKQRRLELAERRMREAQERANTPGYRDLETLGAILSGIGGAKNISQALAGAGVGAGRAAASKNAALRAAEEKYDLQKGQLFDLERLRSQVRMDQLKLTEARATGDKALEDKTAAELAASKEKLATAEFDIVSKLKQQGLEERKVDILAKEADIKRGQAGVAAAAADATRLSQQLNVLETQRLEALRKIEADHQKEYGLLYNMERVSGGKMAPELQAQLNAAKANLAAKQKRVDDALTPRIAEIRARLLGDVGGSAKPGKTYNWNEISGG